MEKTANNIKTPLRDQANAKSKTDSKFGKKDVISDFSKDSSVGVEWNCDSSKVGGGKETISTDHLFNKSGHEGKARDWKRDGVNRGLF